MRAILPISNLIAELKDNKDSQTGSIVINARCGLDDSCFIKEIKNIGTKQFSTTIFSTWMFLQLSIVLCCRKILRLSWQLSDPDPSTIIDVDEFFNKIMELKIE